MAVLGVLYYYTVCLLHFWIIVVDALTCEQHFNIAINQGGVDLYTNG